MDTTIYHNPRCSKSRATLDLLLTKGITPSIVEYLKSPPSKDSLKKILSLLCITARELARSKELAWQEAGLGDDSDEEAILEAMVQYPILIERPIVIRGDHAVIGRPPENVNALID